MPRSLLTRVAKDTVYEFRAAAIYRDQEAGRLADAGYGLAAIYLWGYSAEMIIKAAYFSLIGFSPAQPIALSDLLTAANNTAPAMGIAWPAAGKLHNIECWARLLVAYRAFYQKPYRVSGMDQQLVGLATTVYLRWRKTLRYHKNKPYAHELTAVRNAVNWFITHARQL